MIGAELRRLARQLPDDELATLSVVEEADPRRAAALAALLAMSRETKKDLDRFRIEIDAGSQLETSHPTSEQQRMLAEIATSALPLGTLPLVHVVERGQGSLYALVASPCAAWKESGKTVGATGLLIRAIASRYHEIHAVTIDPWISANGVGLIAHTRRLSVEETPAQQAARLGEALGRVLATLRLEPNDLWRTRNDLLPRLGPGPRPALWHALQALSPQYPGLVLPEGTFASIQAVSLGELQERRGELLRMPLRLAVLENDGAEQGGVLRHALMRWLSLLRLETDQCPVLTQQEALQAGEHRIESRFPDPDDAAVTIAMTLPALLPSDEAHADLLLRMLNRPSGWLAQRMRDNKIVASVAARVVGGSQRRGLVVAIGATPSSIDAATASIRELFKELGTATLPQPSNIAEAIAETQQANRIRRMDPRVRLEDLWLSRGRIEGLDDVSFRNYLKRAFAGSNMLLVRSVRANAEPARGDRSRH
jgi:hypothetical protein